MVSALDMVKNVHTEHIVFPNICALHLYSLYSFDSKVRLARKKKESSRFILLASLTVQTEQVNLYTHPHQVHTVEISDNHT